MGHRRRQISVLIVEVSPSASWSPIYFTSRPHRIFIGPSKCSLAINFDIFQMEFHILREVTKLGVILLNFVDVDKNLRPLTLAALKTKHGLMKLDFLLPQNHGESLPTVHPTRDPRWCEVTGVAQMASVGLWACSSGGLRSMKPRRDGQDWVLGIG